MKGRPVPAAVAGALGAVALAIALPGCLKLGKGYPEKRYYVLRAPSRPGEARPPDGGSEEILKVGRFRISPLYEGKEFVYQKEDLRYESDFYNVFFIPPASLITEEVRRWLGGSARFQHVMDPASHAEGALEPLRRLPRCEEAPRGPGDPGRPHAEQGGRGPGHLQEGLPPGNGPPRR